MKLKIHLPSTDTITTGLTNLITSPTVNSRRSHVPSAARTKYTNDTPKRGDSGVYTIQATNQHGRDEATIEITVVCEYP